MHASRTLLRTSVVCRENAIRCEQPARPRGTTTRRCSAPGATRRTGRWGGTRCGKQCVSCREPFSGTAPTQYAPSRTAVDRSGNRFWIRKMDLLRSGQTLLLCTGNAELYRGSTPSRFILAINVVRGTPSRAAAPSRPPTTPSVRWRV